MQITADLYTTSQIRQLEQIAINDYRISEQELMQRAGKALFKSFKRHWPDTKSLTIFCGGGNNGGDGYVFAYLAATAGLNVSIYILGDPNRLSDVALRAYQACVDANITISTFDHTKEINCGEIIIDALLGIGLKGEVRAPYRDAIDFINHANKPVFAVDIPSGLQSDTGVVQGIAVKATVTQTFIGLKSGCVTGAAKEYCGEILIDDLAIPASAFQAIPTERMLIPFKTLQQQWLSPRARDANKGCFGHVLIIGGDYGMGGAVTMAGMSALRVGAGLVTIATREQHVTGVLANCPELMVTGISDDPHEQVLQGLIQKASVIAIGPGLGQSNWGKRLFEFAMKSHKPLVVDADGLNFLAKHPRKYDQWILTPHPGEAARLLNTTSKVIQEDRYSASSQIQKQYGGVCVLKGSGTLISGPDNHCYVCKDGNPGMAAGGMGDVLTGIITGLVAQHIPAVAAACLGVACHACAADDAATDQGERGIMALDVLAHVQSWVNI